MMLGFEKGKRNAFRVVFEDGSFGWYKVSSLLAAQSTVLVLIVISNRLVQEREKILTWKL
jgi:hypothetical protein